MRHYVERKLLLWTQTTAVLRASTAKQITRVYLCQQRYTRLDIWKGLRSFAFRLFNGRGNGDMHAIALVRCHGWVKRLVKLPKLAFLIDHQVSAWDFPTFSSPFCSVYIQAHQNRSKEVSAYGPFYCASLPSARGSSGVDRSRLMPTAFRNTPHCRLHKHTRAAGVNSLLKACSVGPLVWRGHSKSSTCSNQLRKSASCASSDQTPLKNTQSVPASHAIPVCPCGYQIRRAKPDEADQVAELNAEVHLQNKHTCISVYCLHACPHDHLHVGSLYSESEEEILIFRVFAAHVPGLCMAGIQGHDPWSVEAIH